jgi:hypothetical protein
MRMIGRCCLDPRMQHEMIDSVPGVLRGLRGTVARLSGLVNLLEL